MKQVGDAPLPQVAAETSIVITDDRQERISVLMKIGDALVPHVPPFPMKIFELSSPFHTSSPSSVLFQEIVIAWRKQEKCRRLIHKSAKCPMLFLK